MAVVGFGPQGDNYDGKVVLVLAYLCSWQFGNGYLE
jgi:hypothetical protein